MHKAKFFPKLESVAGQLGFESIRSDRKETLFQLAKYISNQPSNSTVSLNFICTHNSRRSHLAQVWAQAAAAWFDMPNVSCYSGGTEVTAMYPLIAKTLSSQGFNIRILVEGENPVHAVQYSPDAHPVLCFSKKYDDKFNPAAGFAAIMTCAHADKSCPMILAADARFAIPFDDPKEFDGTPRQEEQYKLRSLEIATQMFYLFSMIRRCQ